MDLAQSKMQRCKYLQLHQMVNVLKMMERLTELLNRLVILRLFGSEIDFRRSLSVSVHGMMPFLVATLLTLPVVLSRAELSLKDVQSARYLHSNLAAFASDSTAKPLMAPEFTMIEWYRANAPYEEIMDDCVEIVRDSGESTSMTNSGVPRTPSTASTPSFHATK